jgi:predicted AAA+ superfamily ATPase
VTRSLRQFPVVAVLGARQVGKTTLARRIVDAVPWEAHHFDLEDPRAVARLESPTLALEPLRGLVVLDEIQRRPELFPVLRVLADRPRRPARFLVLGSASPDLLSQTSETLAGRIAYHELGGLDLAEVGARALDRLWLRGGFPLSFTARSDDESSRWRSELVRTFLERDLPTLGVRLAAETMRRFWTMLAHYHAQLWNAAELARAFGVSEKTVRHYADLLVSTFMVRRLTPWHENVGKREVRAPKLYLSDSGLLHTLLGLRTRDDLFGHPKRGASWEGFALSESIRWAGAEPHECHFWRVHSGAELDLLIVRGRRRLGVELKLTDAPKLTPSMRSAMETLALDRLFVVHAGADAFPLAPNVRAVPLRALAAEGSPWPR